jgi:hypothetical protein
MFFSIKFLNTLREVFKFLGADFIPPELREYPLNDLTSQNILNDLIKMEDIMGVVHSHSLYSDGSNTIAEMALASQKFQHELVFRRLRLFRLCLRELDKSRAAQERLRAARKSH